MATCLSQCTDCPCPPGSAPNDIEDCLAEYQELDRRKRQLEDKLKTLGRSLKSPGRRLRSEDWFNDPSEPLMTTIYLERYTNYGLTRHELMSGKPVIGIAQTGSDLVPCNRHHIELAKRVKDGIRESGGIAFEFPTHPMQESGRRPTASLDRNLAYLSLVEVMHGYPMDGVVLLTGCDKTTPACLMAAATLDIPAICLNVGPMINGHDGEALVGSGMIVWKGEEMYATGKVDFDGLVNLVCRGAPSVGHCNTMGTAMTMNSLAEALGMALPGSAAIPAPYKERGQCAYETGLQIVEMVRSDRKPSQVLTRRAFENAIRVNSAIGGSTNAPVHLNAIARHAGIHLSNEDWYKVGYNTPLLLDVQPSGRLLGEEYYRAGGVPAIMAELQKAGQLWEDELTCNGKLVGENVRNTISGLRNVIRDISSPILQDAGFVHLSGNLFDSALMKLSGISPSFRRIYLTNKDDPGAFQGLAVVFDGPEDFRLRIDDPNLRIDEGSILVMRGCGPIGFPGAAETVNMRPPSRLINAGITALPCIGDGRQSGTSPSPSILNASPEAAAGGNLAILKDADIVRVDLNTRRVNVLISDGEIRERRTDLNKTGGFKLPVSQTPWQELYRDQVDQLDQGMTLRKAVKYQRVLAEHCVPRHNH